MANVNPCKAYRQVATLTAPPGRIVLMLFEGALGFLERARGGFALSDPAEFNMAVNNNAQRAQAIIRELNQALDFDQGGELAITLSKLYHYFDRRIQESNLKKQCDGIDEVIRQLSILRDAWYVLLHDPGSAPSVDHTGWQTPR